MQKLYSWQAETLGSVFAMSIRVVLRLCLYGCILGIVFMAEGMPDVLALETDTQEGALYTVAQDGTGDYLTICEAVEQAVSGDTVLIYPGVYTESIVIAEKTVNLTGVDKDTCILQWDASSYESVPLNIGAGTVKNVTIYGMGERKHSAKEPELPEIGDVTLATPDEWNCYFSGYAIHIDQDYSYEKEILFQNCKIISDCNYCVGIGCRGGSTITFRQCEMISVGDGGCMYIHDSIGTDGGKSDVVLQDCSLKNFLPPYLMTVEAFRETNEIYLTFQNVRVSAVAYDKTDVYDAMNLNTGFEVNVLAPLDQLGLLYDMGYSSTVQGKLVTALSREESASYIREVTSDESTLQKKLSLPEGITLLETASHLLKKPLQETQNTTDEKCMVIRILNETKQAGAGWCGSSNIWLTPESYGNTLIEMNALKMEEAE